MGSDFQFCFLPPVQPPANDLTSLNLFPPMWHRRNKSFCPIRGWEGKPSNQLSTAPPAFAVHFGSCSRGRPEWPLSETWGLRAVLQELWVLQKWVSGVVHSTHWPLQPEGLISAGVRREAGI